MNSNLWNIKNVKEKFDIFEKTNAQKRHIMNLLSAKRKIDSRNPFKPKQSHTLNVSICQLKEFNHNNESMVKRIMAIKNKHKLAHSRSQTFSSNLQTYASMQRFIRQKEIEKQNSKIFSRLITTSPTIRRKQWSKSNLQTQKYKQNILKNKYLKPDYTIQVCKLLNSPPKFKLLKTANKLQCNINKIKSTQK